MKVVTPYSQMETHMTDKKELRRWRKRAIKVQNNLYPRKVSMAEAIRLAKKEYENAGAL